MYLSGAKNGPRGPFRSDDGEAPSDRRRRCRTLSGCPEKASRSDAPADRYGGHRALRDRRYRGVGRAPDERLPVVRRHEMCIRDRDNAWILRITAAAGTELADPYSYDTFIDVYKRQATANAILTFVAGE